MSNSLIFAAVTLSLSQFLLWRGRQRRRLGAACVMVSARCSMRIVVFFLLISASYWLSSTSLWVTNGCRPLGVSLPWHLSHQCGNWLPGSSPPLPTRGTCCPRCWNLPVTPSRGGSSRAASTSGAHFCFPFCPRFGDVQFVPLPTSPFSFSGYPPSQVFSWDWNQMKVKEISSKTQTLFFWQGLSVTGRFFKCLCTVVSETLAVFHVRYLK